MKILMAASEMTPLAKTGGLADVIGSLPRALAELGHETAVVMPFYGTIPRVTLRLRKVLSDIVVELPAASRRMDVWKTTLGGGAADVTVYLVEEPGLFDRPHLYGDGGHEYPDNALRYGCFSMAVFWMLKSLNWRPDLILCNDWQTALIPIYRRYWGAIADDPDLSAIPIVFAIHNLSFQGVCPPHAVSDLGLPASAFHPGDLEFYGRLNLLKGALNHSDWITTVSRQYAKEIQTSEQGCGLDGVLREHADRLTGILNGIDLDVWNPETDAALPTRYSLDRLGGKARCKRHLQKRFGLIARPRAPLMGAIGRLTDQKGVDLMLGAVERLIAEGDAQFVLLGSGQPEYHEAFTALAGRYPKRVGVELGFNDELAHQIEAGADLFLMPSVFEPCGLNQMYSMRYGTVPIVRRTGGLADTVRNATPATLASGRATGFTFTTLTPSALARAVRRAFKLYRNDPDAWRRLMRHGMIEDFSWRKSARDYETLFRKVVKATH